MQCKTPKAKVVVPYHAVRLSPLQMAMESEDTTASGDGDGKGAADKTGDKGGGNGSLANKNSALAGQGDRVVHAWAGEDAAAPALDEQQQEGGSNGGAAAPRRQAAALAEVAEPDPFAGY